MRVDPRPQEAEHLIMVGALSGLGRIPDLLARIHQGGWAYAQLSLLSLDHTTDGSDWDLPQRVEAQLSILGASLDAHPLELVAEEIARLNLATTLEALIRPDENISVAGIKQTTQRFFAHEEKPFYILELEDLDGILPVMMSPEFYRQNHRFISSSDPFVVEGKMALSPTTGESVLSARRLYSLK